MIQPDLSNKVAPPYPHQPMVISSSKLLIIAFSMVFFSRIIETLGAPSLINFLHFAAVPMVCLIAISKSRTQDYYQVLASKLFLCSLSILFLIIVASALINGAGFINVVLEFLLLCEPFLILLAITCLPLSRRSFEHFRFWILAFAATNLLIALFQRYVLQLHLSRSIAGWDLIQGVFYFSGAGQVVSASVSISFALYYFVSAKRTALWLKGAIIAVALLQIIVSDTKQIFLALLIAAVVLILTKVADLTKIFQYIGLFTVSTGALYWAAFNVFPNTEILHWANPELIRSGLELKFSVFSIFQSYYESSLHWLFGLGPGHTVGRLGGWMIRDYQSLLQPFGVTKSPISAEVWAATAAHPLGNKSSMWSPLFGWAGIWGDLGMLGLLSYLSIWLTVWKYLCKDDFSQFIVLSVFAFGLIFSQMEEPGYMISVLTIIGMRWHEKRLSKT